MIDGMVVISLLEKIIRQIDSNREQSSDAAVQQILLPSSSPPPSPERLEWIISPEISQRMELAAKSVDKLIADFDYFSSRYLSYGKTFIKQYNVSPDVYMQLALQLAYYK